MPDEQPSIITPLESTYLQAAIAALVPVINGLIYSTNLDVVLHITKLTTNQVWQFVNAILVTAAIGRIVWHRIKDGNDPTSTAPKIVLSKPTT